ncbi:MAG: hypothetical protein JNL74_15440, partial [Fibrobacteres bacterium]|nr:hypothetical protein [Fibrobacterota bacterium]
FPEGKITFQCASDSTLFAFVEFLKEENLFDALRMRFVGMDGIPEIKKEDIRDASVQVDLESMARETLHLVNDVLDGKINEPKSLLVGSRLLLKKD